MNQGAEDSLEALSQAIDHDQQQAPQKELTEEELANLPPVSSHQLARLWRHYYRCGRSELRIPGWSSGAQCRHRCDVSISHADGPRHSLYASV